MPVSDLLYTRPCQQGKQPRILMSHVAAYQSYVHLLSQLPVVVSMPRKLNGNRALNCSWIILGLPVHFYRS